MMDEICEATTPTGYHSADMVTIRAGESRPYDPESRDADSGLDMVTVDNGAVRPESSILEGATGKELPSGDEPALILCGYHELRRLMRQGAAERARRATAGSAGTGGPGGWW